MLDHHDARTPATPKLHPLQRLAMEAPERLVPVLRRAAFRLVRRRLGDWLRRHLLTGLR